MTVTDGAVHKHIRSTFGKLALALDDRSDRRVAAVLRYLNATGRRAGSEGSAPHTRKAPTGWSGPFPLGE